MNILPHLFKTDIDSKIMGQIDNLMNKDSRPYYNAAMYYMDNNKDLNQASAWLDKATAQTPNAYWVWYQKARCLAQLGKKADAMAASQKSMELAKVVATCQQFGVSFQVFFINVMTATRFLLSIVVQMDLNQWHWE